MNSQMQLNQSIKTQNIFVKKKKIEDIFQHDLFFSINLKKN